jgi:hypothetical protein
MWVISTWKQVISIKNRVITPVLVEIRAFRAVIEGNIPVISVI